MKERERERLDVRPCDKTERRSAEKLSTLNEARDPTEDTWQAQGAENVRLGVEQEVPREELRLNKNL